MDVCKELSSNRISKKQMISLITVLILTFVLGFYYVYTHLYSTDFGHDEGYYIAMAQQWAETGVYGYASDTPNAFVPPGLPLFLVLCYRIFGFTADGFAAMRFLQLFFTVVTVFFVYLFGFRLSGKRAIGIIAAGLIAVNLDFYSYTFAFLTENIYFLSMMLFVVFFLHTQRQEKLWPHFVSGLMFCACVMIRSAIVITILFLYIPMIIHHRHQRGYAVVRIALFVLGFVILALPWWIRNAVVLHEFIPFCKQSHIVYLGMSADIESTGISQPNSLLGYLSAFWELFRQDPIGTLYWFTAGKFEILFMEHTTDMFSVLAAIAKSLVVFLGFPVIIRGLFLDKYRWVVIAFFSYLVVVFLGVPCSRYGLQYLFFLSVAAAYLFNILFFESSQNCVVQK